MAQTYKSSGVNISSQDTYTGIYTCPSSTTALINGIYMGNTGAGDDAVSLLQHDNSVTKDYLILSSTLVPSGAALQPLSSALVLEESDSLSGKALSGFLDVVVNVLEIT